MVRTKLFASLLLTLAVLIAPISPAFAASAQDTPTPTPAPTVTTTPAAPITGTVQGVTLQTDSTGATIVVVTLTDSTGATQTVDLSLTDATTLGLVTTDSTGAPVVSPTAVGQSVTIDPTMILPTTQPTPTPENPVGALIASFFGLDVSTMDTLTQDGAGYGVIAQACWMSYELAGDSSLCQQIVTTKQDGGSFSLTLPDGTVVTADNWGQLKKAVANGHHDPLQTLGAIMSGHATPIATETPTPEPTAASASTSDQTAPGNGNGNGNGQGNGNGNGHGNGGQGNGGGNGNGNGHGHNP